MRFQSAFENGFERVRIGYLRMLTLCLDHPRIFLSLFFVAVLVSVAVLTPLLGQDFFPTVDSGSFKIHVRAHTGTRIEETAALCDHIDTTIRSQIPADEVVSIVDNIGLPSPD